MSAYPEHDKLSKVSEQSQAIGAFLDNSPYVLCEIFDHSFAPTYKSIERILADYFEIDLDKIAAEKRQMLDSLRAAS